MRAVAALLKDRYDETGKSRNSAPLKFRTPWPRVEEPRTAASFRPDPQAFANWTIDLAELSAESGSMGSLLVAMRSRLSRGKSKLALAPGSCDAGKDSPQVQHYALKVEWHGETCELTFTSAQS